jgi:hypothetical protein
MEKNEYKLIIPNNSGKQYLTFVGADIYYHGNINKIAIASKRVSKIYFLCKAINSEPNLNGIVHLMFDDFQYSDKLIDISDFDSSTFNNRNELLPFDIYNLMWGELKKDTLSLRTTKPIYYSRSDEIIFIKN